MVLLAKDKHESDSRSRIQAIGWHKISPIWTNMFMHLNKGMQVVIKSNSVGNLILFVLEQLIYTRISFWQSASYIILQLKPVGSLSCHILGGVVVFQFDIIAITPDYTFHPLHNSIRERKRLKYEAVLTCNYKIPAPIKQKLRNYTYLGINQD